MKNFVIIFILLSISTANAGEVSISIKSPEKNANIGCTNKNPDGYCYCPVKGTVSGLEKGQYICIFMQFSGGAVWWVSGNCLDSTQIVDGEWEQNYSSCGKESEKGAVIIKAMILNKPEKSGLNIKQLPKAIAEDTRKITKN